MARQVSRVLVPVEPPQQFVVDLRGSLMSAAMRSRQSLARRYRTAIVIGAALFASAVWVASVAALIVRQRVRGARA